MRIVLGSGSPRRRELLAALVPEFAVIVSDIPEFADGNPVDDAIALAAAKARAVAAREPHAAVIGADTIVHDGVRSYGKPTDAADAIAMWNALRGREHTVVTGIAVITGGEAHTAVSISTVTLSPLDDHAIANYVASGRPMDKAGAYAIQDEDVPTVATFSGCYCGVMGLPLWGLRRLLEAARIATASPDATFARCAACPERP